MAKSIARLRPGEAEQAPAVLTGPGQRLAEIGRQKAEGRRQKARTLHGGVLIHPSAFILHESRCLIRDSRAPIFPGCWTNPGISPIPQTRQGL